MATGQTFINSTLVLIGVLDAGETPSATESADAFVVLNQLLSNWSAAGMPIVQVTRTATATTGAATYTLATRPLKIKSAAVTNGGVVQDCEIVTAEQWTKIVDKTRTSKFAKYLWHDGGYPTGTVYVTPTPVTGGFLELYSLLPLTAIATLGTTIDLPPGHEMALRFAFAEALAPEYGRALSQAVVKGAAEAKAAIGKLNADVLGESLPAAETAATTKV